MGIILLAGAVGFVWHATFSLPKRFAVVEEGVLYRSGQGDRYELANAVERFGIKTIVCVRSPKGDEKTDWLDQERKTAAKAGVEFVYWPTSWAYPPDENRLIAFLRMTQDKRRTPILVHCALGRHRTGFFCAAYRMAINDWPKDKALKEMESLGFDLTTHAAFVNALRNLNVDELKAKVKRPEKSPDQRNQS
jgi:protein tyrosine/serine phosphatase